MVKAAFFMALNAFVISLDVYICFIDLIAPYKETILVLIQFFAAMSILLSLQAFSLYSLLSTLSCLPTRFKPYESFFYDTKEGSIILFILSLVWLTQKLTLSFGWVTVPMVMISGGLNYFLDPISYYPSFGWTSTLAIIVTCTAFMVVSPFSTAAVTAWLMYTASKAAVFGWLLSTASKAGWRALRLSSRVEEQDIVVSSTKHIKD